MTLNHILPFLSTLITFCFAAAVLNRYRLGRKPHSLMWGIGLVLYGIGTFAEAFLAIGWSSLLLRLWFLCGAMLTPAWLGQGTVYLLIRKRGVADNIAILLMLASLAVAGVVFAAPVTAAGYHPGVPISTQYRELLGPTVLMIILTIVLNTYGTIALVGGALWSAYLFARKRVLPNRVLGNILIAGGALLPASAGTFIRLGWGDWLYASELLGAALMFLGFWLATQPQPADRPARVAARA